MPGSVSPPVQRIFDYTSLDAEISQFVQQQTGEIRALIKRTAQDVIEIGQKLLLVKGKLGHGRFLDWIEAEFEWSYPTAARFIQVANSFGNEYQIDKFAPSALYVLAAPSTPDTARQEAIARASAGEPITYTTAKAIKLKHSPPTTKIKPEPIPPPQPTPPPETTSESRPKIEVVALRPQGQPSVAQTTNFVKEKTSRVIEVSPADIPPPQPSYRPETPSLWWQLGSRHLLCCDDPNSPDFMQRIPPDLRLLLAFPPESQWQSQLRAQTQILSTKYLPVGKEARLFEDALESILLLYSELGETVVSCFLPSPEILSIINRLDRRGLFAEPDPKRVAQVISDWKTAGLKAERVSF